MPDGGCPADLLLASRTVGIRVPSGDADPRMEDFTWPADWKDEERGVALKDLPVAFALASSDAAASAAIRLGTLDLIPGASLTAAGADAEGSAVTGAFGGTGMTIPVVGTLTSGEGRVTLEARGKSLAQRNGLGQSRQDEASLSCSRTLSVAPTQ